MDHTIKDIVLLNSITNLDYVDLRNLSYVDKSFSSICENNLLFKGILAITIPNVVFKMNVTKILKSLDNQIQKLINRHYPDLPIWVNIELFMIHMKKKIYKNLARNINDTLDGYLETTGQFYRSMFKKDGSIKIKLDKSFLAFALISNEYEEPRYDDDINLRTPVIILSKDFFNYLMSALGKYEDYQEAQHIIEKVLFF